MARIHLLPPLVQNQIAAGEVVERPVSVLKELVENAIDAGATSIAVILEEGGIQCISVEDNGAGMDAEDASMALVRHATSKIHGLEDLQHIQSMGFRGEALASISSVSRLSLRTKTREAAAAILVEAAGENVQPLQHVGGPTGTMVAVRELFFNVPARRKYLKSAKTELSYCLRYMTEVGILYPAVRLSVEHNGKPVIMWPATSLEERLTAALGKDFLETHLPLSLEHPDLHLSGYISKPHVQLTSRNKQYFFVNRRPVKSDVLQKAVTTAYHRIVDEGRYPSIVLFADVHPALVDVNVHPRKLEVRFHDPHFLFSTTEHAVSQALTGQGHERRIHRAEPASFARPPLSPAYNPQSKANSPYAAAHYAPKARQDHFHPILEAAPLQFRTPESHHVAHALLPENIRVLDQLMLCYILIETPEGLMLVDQHAAHERVLFDKLTRDIKAKSHHAQQLLTPHLLHLTPQDSALLQEHQHLLQEAGFAVEQMDSHTWTLGAIPEDLSRAHVDLDSTFHTLLNECEDMSTGCGSKLLTDYREKLFAYTACRSAVKFGDTMSKDDMEQLIHDLFATERRYTCPHGRTSIVTLDKAQLKRLFDR